MKYLIILSMLVSANVFARDQMGNNNNVNNCNPVLKCESKIVYNTAKQRARIAALEARIAVLEKENAELGQKYNKALIVIHHPMMEREEPNRNAISILGGASPTKLNTSSTPTSFKAANDFEPAVGLMYQHDFGRIRGSVAATLNGVGLLGVGLNF